MNGSRVGGAGHSIGDGGQALAGLAQLGAGIDEVGGEGRVQVAAVRVVRDAVLGLAVGNRAGLAGLGGHQSAKVGDVAAQVVGDALVVVVVAVVVGGVDAWPRDGPVAVRRDLVPFLWEGREGERRRRRRWSLMERFCGTGEECSQCTMMRCSSRVTHILIRGN